MSRTLNKVMLIGNVGKDPEVNFTPTGVKVAQFRLATSETWKDKEGTVQEHTDWHTVIAWRGLADVVEKLVRRGSRLYVEGKIQSRTFEDRDGNKRYVTEIVAENVLLLDTRRTENGGHGLDADHASPPTPQHDRGNTNSDDIPF